MPFDAHLVSSFWLTNIRYIFSIKVFNRSMSLQYFGICIKQLLQKIENTATSCFLISCIVNQAIRINFPRHFLFKSDSCCQHVKCYCFFTCICYQHNPYIFDFQVCANPYTALEAWYLFSLPEIAFTYPMLLILFDMRAKWTIQYLTYNKCVGQHFTLCRNGYFCS